jgi:hypothetical protein
MRMRRKAPPHPLLASSAGRGVGGVGRFAACGAPNPLALVAEAVAWLLAAAPGRCQIWPAPWYYLLSVPRTRLEAGNYYLLPAPAHNTQHTTHNPQAVTQHTTHSGSDTQHEHRTRTHRRTHHHTLGIWLSSSFPFLAQNAATRSAVARLAL